jgi:hypothetical protein
MYITTVTWAKDLLTDEEHRSVIVAEANSRNTDGDTTYIDTVEQELTYTVQRDWPTQESAQEWIDYLTENHSPISTAISIREPD